MVLSPNDEEVASSKKHTQFKTRVHKPYPYFRSKRLKNHTFLRRTYLYSLYKGVPPPPGRKQFLIHETATVSTGKKKYSWIKANVGQTRLYRVNYNKKNWGKLVKQLNRNHKVC